MKMIFGLSDLAGCSFFGLQAKLAMVKAINRKNKFENFICF
jgi:hypothetical protein